MIIAELETIYGVVIIAYAKNVNPIGNVNLAVAIGIMNIRAQESVTILSQRKERLKMRKDEFPLIEAYADSKVKEVLDKIRAEILEEHGYSKDYVGTFTYSTIKVATVLRILDKYKAEGEG